MTAVRREIGDLLVDNGVITQEDLDLVREEHTKTGDSIVDILSKKGLANESQLKNALELEYGVNFVDLSKPKSRPEDDAVNLLTEAFMRTHQVVGVTQRGDRLTLAMVDPSDSAVLEDVQGKISQFQIKPVVCVEDDLIEFLDQFFGKSSSSNVAEGNGNGEHAAGSNGSTAVEGSSATDSTDSVSEAHDAAEAAAHLQGSGAGSKSKAPTHTRLQAATVPEADDQVEKAEEEAVVLLANQILGGAIKRGATHIHIIPGDREAVVNYRVGGGLVVDRKLPKTIVSSVITRYKIMAKLPVHEKVCLDGHIKVKSSAKEIVCLVSIIPTPNGEHAIVWIV